MYKIPEMVDLIKNRIISHGYNAKQIVITLYTLWTPQREIINTDKH